MNNRDTTKLFSNRVENYVKYRPTYPKLLLRKLEEEGILTEEKTIADIGSGTGILTEILLETKCKIFAVEPNDEMRFAAEARLSKFNNFNSVKGTAEASTLEDKSIDIITVAQAFHWFDQVKTRVEFKRILKPEGIVVLIWNERLVEKSNFQKEYDILLKKYCSRYESSKHRNVTRDQIANFYGSNNFSEYDCDNYQKFDFESLKGRLSSSSYTPTKEEENYEPLMEELKHLFDKYQANGVVQFDYNTKMYYGPLFK